MPKRAEPAFGPTVTEGIRMPEITARIQEPTTLEEAIAMQHRLVDAFRKEFNGREQLQAGDYGVVGGLNRPWYTAKVERVLASFFGAEEAALVRGAGTGAIRLSLMTAARPGDEVVMHKPPVYPTTDVTLESLGLKRVYIDLNNPDEIRRAVGPSTRVVYIQHTYQLEDDNYTVSGVIEAVRSTGFRPAVIVDDNYAAMKFPLIGCQLGADLSAFSIFKILGPEGVGCIVGKTFYLEKIRQFNYSGGSQVQGPEAMDALRALVYAPVALAVTMQVTREIYHRLTADPLPGVRAHLANIQGPHLVLEFDQPIADRVLEEAWQLGALPHPVGAESRYELAPLFYRMSATYRSRDPEGARCRIRIIPMRAGADTVLDILRQALDGARRR